MTSSAFPPLSGRVLGGRYQLERAIGEGGMGVVYEAVQLDIGRRVALKLLTQRVTAGAVVRLRTEAEAMARLGNPHVVQVTEFHHNPNEPAFLVMELLHGRSLRQLLGAEGLLTWERAARIGEQVLDALAAAHAARIVHRDIKPENIFMVSSTAIADMVKVLDFGIAKLLEAPDMAPMTRPGALIGTLGYMSPEQARGEPVDERSDLYAVGVCLYEAVSGQRPIKQGDVASMISAIINTPPTSLETYCPHLPPEFLALVVRSLQKDPRMRFQSAVEMASALSSCLGVAPEQPPQTALAASGVPTQMSRAPGSLAMGLAGGPPAPLSSAPTSVAPYAFAGQRPPSQVGQPAANVTSLSNQAAAVPLPHSLNTTQPAAYAVTGLPAPAPRSRNGALIAIVIVALLVVALGGVVAFFVLVRPRLDPALAATTDGAAPRSTGEAEAGAAASVASGAARAPTPTARAAPPRPGVAGAPAATAQPLIVPPAAVQPVAPPPTAPPPPTPQPVTPPPPNPGPRPAVTPAPTTPVTPPASGKIKCVLPSAPPCAAPYVESPKGLCQLRCRSGTCDHCSIGSAGICQNGFCAGGS